MTGFCKTVIPKSLKERLIELKDDTEKLYEFGMNYLHLMCEEILNAKDKNGGYLLPGLHIYTMNTEKCTIQLLEKCKIGFKDNKELEGIIGNELKRVLAEEQARKKKKQQEKMELISQATPIDKGEFKEIKSF